MEIIFLIFAATTQILAAQDLEGPESMQWTTSAETLETPAINLPAYAANVFSLSERSKKITSTTQLLPVQEPQVPLEGTTLAEPSDTPTIYLPAYAANMFSSSERSKKLASTSQLLGAQDTQVPLDGATFSEPSDTPALYLPAYDPNLPFSSEGSRKLAAYIRTKGSFESYCEGSPTMGEKANNEYIFGKILLLTAVFFGGILTHIIGFVLISCYKRSKIAVSREFKRILESYGY